MSASRGGHAAVAVAIPVRRQFTYEVPTALRDRLRVGDRVRVPLGRRRVAGTVVEWPTAVPEPGIELRPIETVLAPELALPAELLELTRFVSDYYLCSWGEAIDAALPPAAPPRPRRFVRRLPGADPESLPTRARRRRQVLENLPVDEPFPLARLSPADRRVVPALAALGLLAVSERTAERVLPGQAAGVVGATPFRPTAGQRSVLERMGPALDADEFAPFLLFGATGSGKTEVYLRAAERVLARGRTVLYLVPEIGLTPLLTSRISERFPGEVAVMHSGLGRGERFSAWDAARKGSRRFVVGARSAVFAPLGSLGLVIVDEEQDSSYKQEESPRYNGRDLAVWRARQSGAVVVLGSATPSMESFQHARSGRYGLLNLGARILDRPLPEVRRVDMREEYRVSGRASPLSRPLIEALRQCMERGEQALILRNRRGWAAALLCHRCGQRVVCDQCSVSMTWHRADRRLRCHTCALEHPWPAACPTCGAEELKMVGEGTEKLESLIRDAVPDVVVERMDRDTIRRRGAHERLLRRFESGEISVLVGTQMIAKGHDFPRVTLVGVISADQPLGLPDFRAGERTFQLLTQVAGRAGRGERPGRVVVQAFDPEHAVLRLAARQDYEAYFDWEMAYRRALRYPPLSALVRILLLDREEFRAREWGEMIGERLREEGGGRLIVHGPGPAPIERARGLYRMQILARTVGRRRLVEAVDRALTAVAGKIPARAIHVDVDAQTLL